MWAIETFFFVQVAPVSLSDCKFMTIWHWYIMIHEPSEQWPLCYQYFHVHNHVQKPFTTIQKQQIPLKMINHGPWISDKKQQPSNDKPQMINQSLHDTNSFTVRTHSGDLSMAARGSSGTSLGLIPSSTCLAGVMCLPVVLGSHWFSTTKGDLPGTPFELLAWYACSIYRSMIISSSWPKTLNNI